MSHQENINRIKTVHDALGDLKDQVVFVGGSTVSLYTDVRGLNIRVTKDVDIIVEIISYAERAKLEDELRSLGFRNDAAIACRFKIQNVVVDIMPTNDESIGFKNQWYPEGFKKAQEYSLDKDTSIKILSAPYFIATKLEAFKSRGKKDGRSSHDFEDIVFILEHRDAIWQEMQDADDEIKSYLKKEFSALLAETKISEWIDYNIDFQSPPSTYYILDELRKFCGMKEGEDSIYLAE